MKRTPSSLAKLHGRWCTLGRRDVLVFDAKESKNKKAVTHVRALFDLSEADEPAALVPFAAGFVDGRDAIGDRTFAEAIREGFDLEDVFFHHRKTGAIFAVLDGSLRALRGRESKIALAKPLGKRKAAGHGEKPLWKLAFDGDLEGVERALEAGADANSHDRDRRSALHHAVMRRQNDIAKRLLASGADLHARDRWNYTATRYAMENGNTALARWLKSKGGGI